MSFWPPLRLARVVLRARIGRCRSPVCSSRSPNYAEVIGRGAGGAGLQVDGSGARSGRASDFCEITICEDWMVRSAGRGKTTPQALEVPAASLEATDRVAMEVSGGAWEVARILELYVQHRSPGASVRSRSRTTAAALSAAGLLADRPASAGVCCDVRPRLTRSQLSFWFAGRATASNERARLGRPQPRRERDDGCYPGSRIPRIWLLEEPVFAAQGGLASFESWLAQRGYSPFTVGHRLWPPALVSRWLVHEGLSVEELTPERLVELA